MIHGQGFCPDLQKGVIITIIEFSVLNQNIKWPKERFVIAGSVGHVHIKANFDSDWDGLTKRFVFANSDITRSVLITSDEPILVPHEVLIPGKLHISIIGLSEDGEKKLTTRKMPLPVMVLEAGPQDGDDPESFTPELWEQALIAIGDLISLNTSAKNSLVSAINELSAKGGSGTGSGTDGVGIDSIIYKETDDEGNYIYTVTLTNGDRYYITAPRGPQGESGTSKSISYITVNTKTASGGLIGDIDGDGIVDSSDVDYLAQCVLNGNDLDIDTADLNSNGIVNNADVMLLSNLIEHFGGGQIITKTHIYYTDGTSDTVFGITDASTAGSDGKSAYEYAKDGGYTGTEEDFSAKMAREYDPIAATAEMTQPVGVNTEGRLMTKPGEAEGTGGYTLVSKVITEEQLAYVAIELPDSATELIAFITTPSTDAANPLYAAAWKEAEHISGSAGDVGLGALSTVKMYYKMHFVKLGDTSICDYASRAMYPPGVTSWHGGGIPGELSGNNFVFSVQYGQVALPVGTEINVYAR